LKGDSGILMNPTRVIIENIATKGT